MYHIDDAVNIPIECILDPKPLRWFSLWQDGLKYILCEIPQYCTCIFDGY